MASVLEITGPAPALLLLAALLVAGARADDVTTPECKEHGPVSRERARQYPTDNVATSLMMSYCSLTEITPDTITGLPNLEVIYLNNNNIENLNPAVVRVVPSLTGLVLEGNKLRELPVFHQHSCPNLTALNVAFNQINGIYNAETFSACAKLAILLLDHNHIDFIHFKVFSALTELRLVHLHNNKITFIPDQMLASNSKLQALLLANNRVTHLPPDFASSLKRVSGAGLQEFFFSGNPWHCACLLELLADVKRAGVINYQGLRYNSYRGVLPECKYISMREYPCRKIRELSFIVHGVRYS